MPAARSSDLEGLPAGRARHRRAGLAVASLLAVLGGSACRGDAPPREARHASLLSELSRDSLPRVTPARLSIFTAYRPCEAVAGPDWIASQGKCETNTARERAPEAVMRLASRAAAAARTNADPDALRVVALIDLLWAGGQRIPLDRSISTLQSAVPLTAHPAPILADLAAAFLTRAEQTQDLRDMFEALEYADQAIEAEPRNAAARFDVALALDRVGLPTQAERAWEAYLDGDSTSAWATEAGARLTADHTVSDRRPVTLEPGASQAINDRFAAVDPHEARRHGWNTALGDWGAAIVRGDFRGAARLLSLAGELGRALARQGGDASLADEVRSIRAGATSSVGRMTIARAHDDYAHAQTLYEAGNYEAAGESFAAILDARGVPALLRQWTMIFRGATLVYEGHNKAGEHMLRRVVGTADTLRYPALAGRARWSLGTTLLRAGQSDAALPLYQRAAALFARAGERENVGAVQYLEGDARLTLGDEAEGYASLARAFQTLRPYRGSVWLHDLLAVAARAAAADGYIRAAIQLTGENIEVSGRTGHSIYVAESELERAHFEIVAHRGRPDATDLAGARSIVGHLGPGAARRYFDAYVQEVRSASMMHTRPALAARALDSAAAYFQSVQFVPRLLEARVARAQALLVSGDDTAAAAALHGVVALLGRERDGVAGRALRRSLLGRARAVFEQMVMLQVASGRSTLALQYLEEGRASDATFVSAAAAPPSWRAFAHTSDVAVDYALIGDTLLIWTIDRGGVRLSRTQVVRARLLQTLARARARLAQRADATAARADLAALFDMLVSPVQGRLGGVGGRVVLIADGALADVPFAALYDARAGRYFVEAHPLRMAGTLRDAVPRSPTAPGRDASVLVVADPAFAQSAFPGLERLAGAEAEARAVATLYPRSTLLDGSDAQPRLVEAGLRRARVVHYAGHAVFDANRPERSMLVLAPDRGEGVDRLTAQQIAGLDLRHVRLVVLSACQTERSASGRTGGFDGLADAFTTAGVGGVVGSLWQVDDRGTAALMLAFHRWYRQTGDAAAALREAQVELLRSGGPAARTPAVWAAFRYIGH